MRLVCGLRVGQHNHSTLRTEHPVCDRAPLARAEPVALALDRLRAPTICPRARSQTLSTKEQCTVIVLQALCPIHADVNRRRVLWW
jgi:hypothetical protein